MEKSNVIISIIIVLCIAAAVAAYGITNSDNPVFSNLTGMDGNNNAGHGVGNHTNVTNPASQATTSGSSGANTGSSSGGSSSGTSSSGSSNGGSNGGSSSNGGSNSGNGGSSSNVVPSSTIQNDAAQYIGEPGCYAGTPYQSGDYWIVPIYDSNGTQVDSIGYTLSGQYMGRM